MIKCEIVDSSCALIWVQSSINFLDHESSSTGGFIHEFFEIVTVVVIKDALKIHDNQIVIV